MKNISFTEGSTGIICANDSTAAVLMATMNFIGVEIRSDLIISGYDNMKYAGYLKHPLTSYSQPCEEIADVAIELMMRRVQNKKIMPLRISLIGEVVPRESTIFL